MRSYGLVSSPYPGILKMMIGIATVFLFPSPYPRIVRVIGIERRQKRRIYYERRQSSSEIETSRMN
jgi:hypothetical protein